MSNIPFYTFLMGDNSFSTTDLKELSPLKWKTADGKLMKNESQMYNTNVHNNTIPQFVYCLELKRSNLSLHIKKWKIIIIHISICQQKYVCFLLYNC